MPWYLRIGFRPERWLSPAWLPAGEVQGDAVRDFNSVKDCAMSVFVVNSEPDSIRAAVAIACQREQDRAFGYALFDMAATQALGIRIVVNQGDTPDAVVNGWHHELQQLTFDQLSQLAKLIMRENRIEDIPLPTFKDWVRQAIDEGKISKGRVHRKNLE